MHEIIELFDLTGQSVGEKKQGCERKKIENTMWGMCVQLHPTASDYIIEVNYKVGKIVWQASHISGPIEERPSASLFRWKDSRVVGCPGCERL
jgi:hypothetical protein